MVAVHPIPNDIKQPVIFSEKDIPVKTYLKRINKKFMAGKNALADIFQDCFNKETVSMITM